MTCHGIGAPNIHFFFFLIGTGYREGFCDGYYDRVRLVAVAVVVVVVVAAGGETEASGSNDVQIIYIVGRF